MSISNRRRCKGFSGMAAVAVLVAGSVFCSARALFAQENPWHQRIDKEGISVSTRKVEGSPILEFKAAMTVDAPAQKAAALLEDSGRLSEWYYQCVRSEIVEEKGSDEKICYFVMDMPWPVATRDAVFRQVKSLDQASGAITFTLTALPERMPKQKKKIRIPYLKTEWRFTPLPDGRTEVFFQQHSDAGGSIPVFVVNALVLDIPFHSLKNFRDLLMKQK